MAALDDLINGEDGLDMKAFLPGVASFGQVAGKTYYLTKDYSPLVLYYNKTLFDAAGTYYCLGGGFFSSSLKNRAIILLM